MGETLGERGRLMFNGPSRIVEAIIAVFLPPACREEVLGDLYERYRSLQQYSLDALRTVPLVIMSRIRRTADPQLVLIQAFTLYIAFLSAAWFADRALLGEQRGLLRLAIPAGTELAGLILDDVYANRGRSSLLKLARGPAVGLGLAFVLEGVFWASDPNLAVPLGSMLYGCALSLTVSSALRMMFPPGADQLQGVSAPAHWLKQAGGTLGNARGASQVVFVIVAVAIATIWVAYQVWKRG